jgi:hypothetical protein
MATFMVKGNSHNWLFNSGEWPYFTRPGPWHDEFWASQQSGLTPPTLAALLSGLAIALAGGTISSRLGLAWGSWMSRVRR